MKLLEPNRAAFHFMSARVRNTPDASSLFEYEKIWLFVYDGYQSKHENFAHTLKFGPTLIPGYSTYPTVFTMKGFSMFFDTPSHRVVALSSEESEWFPRAKIKGQLHLVSPQLIHYLDSQYENGVLFRRRRVKLILPYHEKAIGPWKTLDGKPLPRALQGWRAKEGPEKTHILEASMYTGRWSHWLPKLDAGYNTLQCPILFPNVKKNWLPSYYEYTRTFEQDQREWAEAQRRTG